MKKKVKVIIGIALAVTVLVIAGVITVNQIKKHVNHLIMEASDLGYVNGYESATEYDHREEELSLLSQGYVPLNACMTLSGYTADSNTEYVYSKTTCGVNIAVSFDMEEQTCTKNDYQFSVENAFYTLRGVTYILSDSLTAITNDVYVVADDGSVSATPIDETYDYSSSPWTEERMISHAGGCYRDVECGYISYYTNSQEALTQNYCLGSRVFEFDFALTTDGRLAAVHDWDDFANHDGQPVSSEEWANLPAESKPETDGVYTTMFVEDILDEMLVNRDMFLITDVKSDELSEEEILAEFGALYQAAMDRDPALLNRIVPQIYSVEMYDWIMSIYDFPSVIFTCYRTDLDAQSIISFCVEKDNIPVITAPYEDERFGEEEITEIHENGLMIYNHTISGFTKMYECLSRGIDGIYTNSLLPQDYAVYREALSQHVAEPEE